MIVKNNTLIINYLWNNNYLLKTISVADNHMLLLGNKSITETIGRGLSIEEALGGYFNNSKLSEVVIWCFNADDVQVGFCFIAVYKLKKSIVLRLALSVNKRYRHRIKIPYVDFAIEMLKIKSKNLGTPIVYFSNPINPITYSKIREFANDVFESNIRMGKRKRIMEEIYSNFNLDMLNLTVQSPYKMENSDIDWELLRKKDKNIDFFISKNPDFKNGEGLITLVPFSIKNIIFSLYHILKLKIKNYRQQRL